MSRIHIDLLQDDVGNLQTQVDDAKRRRRPGHCLICGHKFVDEEDERVHMAEHQRELDECRKKRGLKPYGFKQSPSLPRKRKRTSKSPTPSEHSNSKRGSPSSGPNSDTQSSPPPRKRPARPKRKAFDSIDDSLPPPPPGRIRRKLVAVEIPVVPHPLPAAPLDTGRRTTRAMARQQQERGAKAKGSGKHGRPRKK